MCIRTYLFDDFQQVCGCVAHATRNLLCDEIQANRNCLTAEHKIPANWFHQPRDCSSADELEKVEETFATWDTEINLTISYFALIVKCKHQTARVTVVL